MSAPDLARTDCPNDSLHRNPESWESLIVAVNDILGDSPLDRFAQSATNRYADPQLTGTVGAQEDGVNDR